jgi:hypothetical protein
VLLGLTSLFSRLTKLGTSYLGGGIGGKYITYIFTMLRREKDFFLTAWEPVRYNKMVCGKVTLFRTIS